jgi:hypothetical protein
VFPLLLLGCHAELVSEPRASRAATRGEERPAPPAEGERDANDDAARPTDAREAPRSGADAVLAEGTLIPCHPSGLGLESASPLDFDLAYQLAGCTLRRALHRRPQPVGLPHPETTLERVESAEEARCPSGHGPEIDLDADTYLILTDVHRSSDNWEAAFAVDDGERAHVAVRLRRTCQGVPPQDVLSYAVLRVSGAERPVTVHRCEPVHPPCGEVP